MYKDYSKYDIADMLLFCVLGLMVGLILFLIIYIAPMNYKTNRICAEKGYNVHSYYMDGSIYCSRRGEFGEDEIIKVQ